MLAHCKTKAVTLTGVMVALAVGSIVLGFILLPYLGLQRGLVYASSWSDCRTAQTRLLDAMAQDLRNATAVTTTSGSLPLTLTIPARYSAYASTGAFAGDPQTTGSMVSASISSTTGKVVYANPSVTVYYEQSGGTINRRLKQTGVADSTRSVADFGNGVSVVFFTDSTKATKFLASSPTKSTIVPVVSATTTSIYASSPWITGTLTCTIFLRAVAYQ